MAAPSITRKIDSGLRRTGRSWSFFFGGQRPNKKAGPKSMTKLVYNSNNHRIYGNYTYSWRGYKPTYNIILYGKLVYNFVH